MGVSIKKGFRGRGIGTALLKATLEKCRGRFEIIELTVLTNNEKAKNLYEELGFKTYGRRERALKRGGRYFADDLMSLDL